MVLTKVKGTIEAYLGTKVTYTVVTVPACESELLVVLVAHCRRLQRRAAVGNERRGRDRRPERSPHHQQPWLPAHRKSSKKISLKLQQCRTPAVHVIKSLSRMTDGGGTSDGREERAAGPGDRVIAAGPCGPRRRSQLCGPLPVAACRLPLTPSRVVPSVHLCTRPGRFSPSASSVAVSDGARVLAVPIYAQNTDAVIW